MSPILKTLSFLLILLLYSPSCREKKEETTDLIKKNALQEKDHFLITSNSDTLLEQQAGILRGVPIPAKGKRINPDSVARPKTIPLRGRPKVAPVHTNVFPVGTPKVVQVPKELTVITPGENGVPIPKTIPARGKVVSAVQPPPVFAAALQMKDAATNNIQYLDVDQGMNASSVWSMLADSRGNLWFGTWGGGVSRYDGTAFTHYTMKEGLSNNIVQSILEDNQGNLWFGTADGVNRYDGSNFTYYNNVHSIMLEDRQGNLWFGTLGGGVSCYNGATFTHYTTEEGLSHNNVRSMLEDSQGTLWFGTAGGVTQYDGHNFTHYTTAEGLSHNNVRSMLEDSQGNLWFGTLGGGVSRYNGATFTHYTTAEGLSHNNVLSILEDPQDNLWFGTDGGGVNCYDGRSFTYYTTKEGLSHNNVLSILEGPQGNLWFGTWGGVNRFGKLAVTNHTMKKGLSSDVRSLLEDSQGNLWFGTWDGGVNQYDGSTITNYTIEEGLSHNNVNSILEDSQGNLWFGTWGGGVSRYNPAGDGTRGNFTHYTTEEGLSNNYIHCILEDRQGHLWFGTVEGVNRFDPNGNQAHFTHFTTKEGLSHNNVLSMLEDSQGNLWFGTLGRGVSRYDPAKDGIGESSFTHYTTEDGLSDNYVSCILEDSQGKLWFGTGEGVSVWNKSGFTRYGREEGFSHTWVYSILEDSQKNVWISTKKEIALVIPLQDESASSGDYKFFTLGNDDGLTGLNTTSKSTYWGRHNRICFGTTSGLMMLDLNQFELPTAPPRIRLNTIEVKQNFVDYRRLSDTAYQYNLDFGKTLEITFDSVAAFQNYPTHMVLPHHLNHLTFQFSAIDWAAPHKVKYSYRMEGLEEQWSPLHSIKQADYRSLPAGTYTFMVKAIGAAQVWSEPFEYTFRIRPPWWATYWAYGFYFFVIVSVLSVFYHFQLNRKLLKAEAIRLRELDHVKTQLYTNITHEFRTPLTIINGMANQLMSQVNESAKTGLHMIRRNGLQLLHLVNQILDLRKFESGAMTLNMKQGDIIQYLRYIQESFHTFAAVKDIRLHFLSEKKEIIMDFDPEKILTIVSNLLSNAIKFTPEKRDIYLIVDDKSATSPILSIKIKDTGIGIPAEKLPFIFDRFYQADDQHTRQQGGSGIGLALTKGLVQFIGGEIRVESEAGQGTEFTVLLPIQQSASVAETISAAEVKEKAQVFIPAIYKGDIVIQPTGKKDDKPLLLVVEDNKDVVSYLQSCLDQHFQLAVAYNGREGIDKALEIVPDIIISDIMMPEVNGLQLLQTLKNDLRTSHIPIIMLTAKADIRSKIEGLDRGADAYLAKPFQPEELLVRLKKLIELRQKLQAYYSTFSPKAPEGNDAHKKEYVFIKQIHDLLEAHAKDETYGILELCRAIGISRTQLFRKLKALTNKSASHYIRSFRLQKAKEMLKTTSLNISEIAYEVGFKTAAYFSTSFSEEFGMTPSEMRDKHFKEE